MRCPENCIDQHCFPTNGSCVLGCNWNYCKNDRCDKITNMCIDGCNEGITGDFCIGESYIAIKIFIDCKDVLYIYLSLQICLELIPQNISEITIDICPILIEHVLVVLHLMLLNVLNVSTFMIIID